VAVDVGDGHHPRVSPRWVVEIVRGFYHLGGWWKELGDFIKL
jgi:hypothetical protein